VNVVRTRLSTSGIADIAEKLDAGERLSFEERVRLFHCPDLQLVGSLANRERETPPGAPTYSNFNIRL